MSDKILATQDGPAFMAEEARAFGYPFPYLYDEVCSVVVALLWSSIYISAFAVVFWGDLVSSLDLIW